jgi:hypothetical protein
MQYSGTRTQVGPGRRQRTSAGRCTDGCQNTGNLSSFLTKLFAHRILGDAKCGHAGKNGVGGVLCQWGGGGGLGGPEEGHDLIP